MEKAFKNRSYISGMEAGSRSRKEFGGTLGAKN